MQSWNLRLHPRQRAHWSSLRVQGFRCYSLPWRRCDCTSHFSHFRRYTSKMFSRFLPLPAFAARASFWPYTCGHSTSSSHTDGIRISQMFGKRRLVDVPKCRPIRFRYTSVLDCNLGTRLVTPSGRVLENGLEKGGLLRVAGFR